MGLLHNELQILSEIWIFNILNTLKVQKQKLIDQWIVWSRIQLGFQVIQRFLWRITFADDIFLGIRMPKADKV